MLEHLSQQVARKATGSPRISTSYRRFRCGSPPTRQTHWPWRCVNQWQKRPSKNKKITYIAGTTGVTTLGFLSIKQDRSQFPDDPLDLTELATVPFNRLCSGWISFAFCSSLAWVGIGEPLYNVPSN
ncbi:hypothetical protein BJX96DRAFT_99456 [Aspergillus floccosus]